MKLKPGVLLYGQIGDHGPVARVTFFGPSGEAQVDVLLDTAARFSVMSDAVAKRIGAPIIGKRTAKGVCGSCDLDIGEADLRVGPVLFPKSRFLCKTDLEPYGGLLGQDFLKLGTLSCDGIKRTYSFRR